MYKYSFGIDLDFPSRVDINELRNTLELNFETYEKHTDLVNGELVISPLNFSYFFELKKNYSSLDEEYGCRDYLKSFLEEISSILFAHKDYLEALSPNITIKVYYDNNADFSEEELEDTIFNDEDEFDDYDLDNETIQLLANINASIEYESFVSKVNE